MPCIVQIGYNYFHFEDTRIASEVVNLIASNSVCIEPVYTYDAKPNPAKENHHVSLTLNSFHLIKGDSDPDYDPDQP